MSCSQHGLLEIKCSYSKLDNTPEAVCELENSEVRLKRSHPYYYQVQLQLYVASDSAAWCDFCIYTCKGISIDRIFPDQQWQDSAICHFTVGELTLKFSYHLNLLFVNTNQVIVISHVDMQFSFSYTSNQHYKKTC